MLAFVLVLARIAPLFLLAPLFSSKTLPAARAHVRRASRWPSASRPIAVQAAGGAAVPTDVSGSPA